MGKYLDILARAGVYDINDRNDQSFPLAVSVDRGAVLRTPFGRLSRFGRILSALEARCPDRVPIDRWQLAVQDGCRFLAQWDEQAEALGWTAKDVFGLLTVPEHAKPSFNRLSRYDETGLIWLLDGRRVVALTENTAAIQNPATGLVTTYRRHNKPALGPLGDSLNDSSPRDPR
jgi:hypothetical protein